MIFKVFLFGLIFSQCVLAQTPSSSSGPTPAATPHDEGQVVGLLLERGTKRPLSQVNLYILPMKLKATTDAKGNYKFVHVPQGEIEIVVNYPGYKKYDQFNDVNSNETLDPKIYLERDNYHGLEATVVGKVDKVDDSSKTMSKEEFLTVPGANGDPVKAIQNMPGVAHVSGLSSNIVIEGSAPQDTGYLIDEHQVPLIFHFGGLYSVITPEAIESVDYLSAGYGPEYGRAMGGLVGLHTRDPQTDRQHGFAFMDTMKSGALLEGPINDKSSFLVTGRYSYLSLVLGAVVKGNSQFNMTVAPAFGDFEGLYKLKASDKDEVRVLTLFSHDELSFLFKTPVSSDPSIRGTFDDETTFYRVTPQWTHHFDSDHTGHLSMSLGEDDVHVDVGSDFSDQTNIFLSQRADFEAKISRVWKTTVGLDDEFVNERLNIVMPISTGSGGVSNPISSGSVLNAALSRNDLLLGPYWRNVIHDPDSKWTWMPSLRVDYFNVTNEVLPAPRFAVRYDQSDSFRYKAMAGVYYQPPQVNQTAPGFGNPDVKSPFALHYVLGFEKDFKGTSTTGFTVNADIFYKSLQNLVVSTSDQVMRNGALVPEIYNNDGRGRAYGVEALIKYDKRPFSAWVSYTVSRSLRNEPSDDEHLFEYDQTHNLNIVAQLETASNWKISGRARYVTGDPFTPVAGATFDADNDNYIPTPGSLYSQRMADFFQMDVRLDKKWIHNEWIFSAYLDVQNITNRQNPEAIRYSYDYSQTATVNDLPILPTLGIRGEF